jgi:hypothetical protein
MLRSLPRLFALCLLAAALWPASALAGSAFPATLHDDWRGTPRL